MRASQDDDGIHSAPKGILLETPQEIAGAAHQIWMQAARTTAMPPANVSWMESEERALIDAWYRAGKG